jgi:hypothetical protein
LQVQSCTTADSSGVGPDATAVTVGTDSEGIVLVGGMVYFGNVYVEVGERVVVGGSDSGSVG